MEQVVGASGLYVVTPSSALLYPSVSCLGVETVDTLACLYFEPQKPFVLLTQKIHTPCHQINNICCIAKNPLTYKTTQTKTTNLKLNGKRCDSTKAYITRITFVKHISLSKRARVSDFLAVCDPNCSPVCSSIKHTNYLSRCFLLPL